MKQRVHTDKAPQAIGPYSQAMVVNGMVYTSGQLGIATLLINTGAVLPVSPLAGTTGYCTF